jgi:tetratricopeptide (TPR) repeat protein
MVVKINKMLWVVLGLSLFVGFLSSCSPQVTAEDYFNQGKNFYENKKYDQAIACYNEAIKLNPNLVKAYNNRGIAYIVETKYDQAIADFNKAIEFEPSNGKAYNNRAVAYWYKEEAGKAEEDIKKAQSLGIKIDLETLKKLPKPPKKTD